jgi:Tol biopolymer transport system component
VVIARRTPNDNGDVHLLQLDDGGLTRSPVTQTPGMDESAPRFGSDGTFLVFVREDALFRLDLATGRARRLTGGFRQVHAPRVMPSGRILYLWREDKRFGIDAIDAAGKSRETLREGYVYYRTLAPSPDGRFFAVTFTYDLGFHPADALKLRQTEEVRLLDAQGQPLATLARSWRYANMSPDWASGGVDTR